MNRPETKKPRRYRLNKKKFAAVLFVLGCIAALIIIAAVSLENADTSMAGVVIADLPNATEYVILGSTIVADTVSATPSVDKTNELDGRVIVVDAGHGGFDPGAIGVSGTQEDELNLAIAQYLEIELENGGAQVIMTRENENALADDKDSDMAKRRQVIEQSEADIVISIHMNYFEDDPDTKGPLVLFMPGSEAGKSLAEALQGSMNAALDADGTARSDDLYILRSGNMPCVLIECGYISNEEEERKLSQPDYQQSIAKAICEGLNKYFSQKKMEG